eukprot:11861535-Alexandrium_andersonii.AAC.1
MHLRLVGGLGAAARARHSQIGAFGRRAARFEGRRPTSRRRSCQFFARSEAPSPPRPSNRAARRPNALI